MTLLGFHYTAGAVDSVVAEISILLRTLHKDAADDTISRMRALNLGAHYYDQVFDEILRPRVNDLGDFLVHAHWRFAHNLRPTLSEVIDTPTFANWAGIARRRSFRLFLPILDELKTIWDFA